MRVVINRSDAIGDTLLTIPMAQMIKKSHPSARIVFIISSKSYDLFRNHPYVDEVWVLEKTKNIPNKWYGLYKKFRNFKADAYFYVGGPHLPSYIAFFSRVKFRGGLVSKWHSFFLLNKGVRQSRSMVVMHEYEYNLNLLAPLKVDFIPENPLEWRNKVVQISDDEAKEALVLFNQELTKAGLNPNRDIIVIHPGMTGHTLNWSSRNYGRLISRIEINYPSRFNYIISFTPTDSNFLIGLRSHLDNSDQENLKGKFYFLNGALHGLRNFMGVLKFARIFIGPSTGPTHIANILGIPMVGIYSPIKVQSSKRWGPLIRDNGSTKIVVPDVVCGEQFQCAGEKCPYYECMAKIEVEDIYNEVKNLLEYTKK